MMRVRSFLTCVNHLGRILTMDCAAPFHLLIWGVLFIGGNAFGGDDFENRVRPYLQAHCFVCHGAEKQKGNIRLDTLTDDFTDRETATIWLEARDLIHLGEMPPDDQKRPKIYESEQITSWIALKLRQTARDALVSKGGNKMRRMNRHEYTHTIADLLHIKFPTGESPLDTLPPDGTAEGFDKLGAALMMDPSLLQQYYQVARAIADRAIVDGPPDFPTETMRLEFKDIEYSRAIGYLISRLGMNPVEGGLELIQGSTRSFGMLRYPGRRDNNVAPVNGFYRFSIRAGGARGAQGVVPRMALTHSHPDESMKTLMEVDVKAPWDQPEIYSVVLPRDTLGGELQVRLLNETDLYMSQRPGEHFMRQNRVLGEQGNFTETIRLTGRKIAEGWGGDRSTPHPDRLDTTVYPRLFLDYLEVEGPLYDQWPPKSHETFFETFNPDLSDLDNARNLIARFLPRAWRRPVETSEIESIVQVIVAELEQGLDFKESLRVGICAALTSPHFLYLVQSSKLNQEGDNNDYTLASRLSYFLWNSMPDDRLFELAEKNKLRDPDILRTQVQLMMNDPKIERFVQSFARQWLRTDSFLAFAPDNNIYKQYDKALGKSSVLEALAFFRTIFNENLSVLNFLDSDFVIINNRLARHYGIPGIDGDHFRKVMLPPESPRGGLLGMMGIHLAGADGIRTKPVSRAVYLREVLFQDPPDPPPANAGEVEPNIKGEQLTVRERLAQHQAIETCASCHRSLDPYGLALENFNAIGLWRDHQDGENFRGSHRPEIDISGTLPNGKEFDSFETFRTLIVEQSDRFRRALAEKLFVYAIGRPVFPSDDAALQRVVENMRAHGDTFAVLIESIVTSTPFLNP